MPQTHTPARLCTGITGLDEILEGGFLPRRAYLIHGAPGAGKTILGLHFLVAGLAVGERGLFITLGESPEQIQANAASLGMTLEGLSFLDLSPTSTFFSENKGYSLFAPADVESGSTTQAIIAEVEGTRPQRVVLDAMTHLRYLTSDTLAFRRQAHACVRFLVEQGATVVFTSEGSVAEPDDDLQYMSDGVVSLDRGPQGRALSVSKFRGSGFHGGAHTLRLGPAGMQVFPRLVPEAFGQPFVAEAVPSGIPGLDELLHGGLERGTVTLISGPTGVGKTTLGLQFMKEAAGRGERSVVYTFEETRDILLHRCEAINIPVRAMIERGTLRVEQVEPLHYTPDQFAYLVRQEVEKQHTRIVMIDSTAGYRLAIPGEDLVSHLHALAKYLKNMGVTVLLIHEIEGVLNEFRATQMGISYLADTIVFLRYREMRGELRRVIGVLKKRTSDFGHAVRELEITRYGLKVGPPLPGVRGLLGDRPEESAAGEPGL